MPNGYLTVIVKLPGGLVVTVWVHPCADWAAAKHPKTMLPDEGPPQQGAVTPPALHPPPSFRYAKAVVELVVAVVDPEPLWEDDPLPEVSDVDDVPPTADDEGCNDCEAIDMNATVSTTAIATTPTTTAAVPVESPLRRALPCPGEVDNFIGYVSPAG